MPLITQNASELSHPRPWIPCSHHEFHIFQVLCLNLSGISIGSESRFPSGVGMAQEEYGVLPNGWNQEVQGTQGTT